MSMDTSINKQSKTKSTHIAAMKVLLTQWPPKVLKWSPTFVDHCFACIFCQFSTQPFPQPHRKWFMAGTESGKSLLWNSFSFMMLVGGHLHLVPAHRAVPCWAGYFCWAPTKLWWHQFPSSSVCNEFNLWDINREDLIISVQFRQIIDYYFRFFNYQFSVVAFLVTTLQIKSPVRKLLVANMAPKVDTA